MKYYKNSFNLILGIGWLAISLLGMSMVLFFTMTPLSLGWFILVPISLVLLSALCSAMHFSVYFGKRTYVIIDQEYIQKDNGLIRPKSTLEVKNISKVMIIGNSLRISESSGKEMRINLDCLGIDDICILKEKLGLH